MTGFRKALKKFEKVTKIPVQTAYMREKVLLLVLLAVSSSRLQLLFR
jgi:hypothetical protein